MSKNQYAASLFYEYRHAAEHELETYNRLKTINPHGAFPKVAARAWRAGMLAEMWGMIATELGGTVDFLRMWREGL